MCNRGLAAANHDDLAAALACTTSTAVRIIKHGGPFLQRQIRVCRLYRGRLTYLTLLNSYIEGIVRGYRNALLTSQNYSNLTQCENIDGMSMSTAYISLLTR
jgi:hypothetical protein